MTCNRYLFKPFFRCCYADDDDQPNPYKIEEDTSKSMQREAAANLPTTSINTEIASQQSGNEESARDRNDSLYDAVQHMCDESASSFGDSLLSFKLAVRGQAQPLEL